MTSAMRNNNLISVRFYKEVTRHAHMAAGPDIPGSHHRFERLRHEAAGLDSRAVLERFSYSLDASELASDPTCDNPRSD